MKEFYRVLKTSPFTNFEKNDLIVIDGDSVTVKSGAHTHAFSKALLTNEMIDAMMQSGMWKKYDTPDCPYAERDIIAVRSEHLYGDKSLKKKRWTVSICFIDKIETKMTYKNGTKVVLTVYDIYGDKSRTYEVQSDKVIGKTTKYWYINSHNEVATDYFYRSEYDDKIRLATGNCFVDDESCRNKIRDNEQKMNALVGPDLEYLAHIVDNFEAERTTKKKGEK